MKKILTFLAVLFLIGNSTLTHAQCGVMQVGGMNFEQNSLLSDMAVAPNGTVYTFAYNTVAGNYQLYSNSSSWLLAATLSGSTAVKPSISISKTTGKLSVLVSDNTNGGRAKVYTLSGGTMIQVGGTISTGSVTNLSITFDNSGNEYIAYTDVANSNRVTVRKWDGVSSWDNVGTGVVSVSGASYNSITIDKAGNPVLAFQDANAGNKTSVYRYLSGSWSNLGSFGSTNTNSQIKVASNGDYYLGYTEPTSVSVQKYDGSTWAAVGTSLTSLSSSANTFDLELDDADTPYLLAIATGTPELRLYKFSGSVWSAFIAVNNVSAPNYNIGLSIHESGTPYIFNVENQSSNGLNVRKIVSTVSVINPSSQTVCNGSTAIFNTNAVGGSVTYQWQQLSANSFINVPTATTTALSFAAFPAMNQNVYRCVISELGCKNSITNTATLTVSSPVINLTTVNPICSNTSDGSITSIVSGGSGMYNYSWSPGGQTTQNVTGLYAGAYSVSVTDINFGCIASQNANLTAPPAVSSSFSGSMTICSGSSTTLTITSTGGIGPYIYNWSPGGSLNTTTGSVVVANPSSTQTYNVQITDANSCITTNTVMVTVTPSPTISATSSSSAICVGGLSTLNATGVGVDTYLWLPGNMTTTSPGVNPLSTTIYTVTGTNTTSGCKASTNVTLTVNPLPIVSTGGSRTLTCVNTSTTITAGVSGGTAPYNYSWSGPGSIVNGSTPIATINTPGIFTVLVSDSKGCYPVTPSTVSVSQNTLAPSPSASTTGTLTCSSLSVSVNGLPNTGVTYLWSGPGIIGSTTTQNTAVNTAGTYTLKVTDAVNGCTNTAVTAVSQNTVLPTPSANNTGPITCYSSSVTLNGTPATGVTYLWTGPGLIGPNNLQNANASIAATYTLKVTSAVNGCTNTAVTTVFANNTPPSVTNGVTNTLTCIMPNANVNATSISGTVNYTWTGSGITSASNISTITVNQPGVKNYTVTNTSNGCYVVGSVTVLQNTVSPTVSGSISNSITCAMNTADAIASTVTSPVSYTWQGSGIVSGNNTATITVNTPGVKDYTVTNTSNGCETTGSVTIDLNTTPPLASASSSGTLTCATTTVSLYGMPFSGVTYLWSGPGIVGLNINQDAVANAPGTYSLFVTDNINMCSSTVTTTVNQDIVTPLANAGMDQTLTCSTTTVNLIGSATPSTCTPVWIGGVSSGANTFNATTSTSGTYTLSVTNPSNGCVGIDEVFVTANTILPTVSVNSSNILNCTNVTAVVSATSNPTSVSYLWNGPNVVTGNNTANATVDQPGSYTVTVTDFVTGCTNTANIGVLQDITPPIVTINTPSTVICSGNSLTLTANGAITYLWNTAETTNTISVTPSSTQTYTVIGTAVNGCINTITETITVNSITPVSIFGDLNICLGSSSTLTATGATSYTWNTNQNTTSISVTPTISTIYSVSADNGTGCIGNYSVTLNILASKSISGLVTSTTSATNGDVILYKYESELSKWDSVTTIPFTSNYNFITADSGLYVLRAIPSATNIQVTYAPNSISWQDATVVSHGCMNNTVQNIQLVGLENFTAGPGVLTGTIKQGNGFGERMASDGLKPLAPGAPIGGIIVKGGKNPGGQMFVQTTSGLDGTYTLTGLPAGEEYFILVDIPGLDTNGTYYRVITNENTTYTNLDFLVDSMYIHPMVYTGFSNELSVVNGKVSVFPNPARDNFKIEYELTESAQIEIDLYNILGEKVKEIEKNTLQLKDSYSYSVNLSDIKNGVYFVKLKINQSITTIKLIISE